MKPNNLTPTMVINKRPSKVLNPMASFGADESKLQLLITPH